jgi:hypothetical protein
MDLDRRPFYQTCTGIRPRIPSEVCVDLADHLEKLQALREKGVLTEAEFLLAKEKILRGPERGDHGAPPRVPNPPWGHAADRWVNLQLVKTVVGAVFFLLALVFIFLPFFQFLGNGAGSGPRIHLIQR